MTIEASLQVELGKQNYVLTAKMIRIDSASYFFIRDKEVKNPLLGEAILQLTYADSFSLTEFSGEIKSPGIPATVITAIQNSILQNKELWF